MDLIRCPGVLGKIFGPLRVHRGCPRGSHRMLNLGSQREQISALNQLSKFAYFAQFGLILSQIDPVWTIWLILCQLCCINELSVALSHQNLKLGADFTLKMAICQSVLQVDPIESLLWDLESSIHMAWELWFIYSLACHTLPGNQEGTF